MKPGNFILASNIIIIIEPFLLHRNWNKLVDKVWHHYNTSASLLMWIEKSLQDESERSVSEATTTVATPVAQTKWNNQEQTIYYVILINNWYCNWFYRIFCGSTAARSNHTNT